MSNYLFVRLGKDSVPDIRKIDSLHSVQSPPLTLTVKCKQVPREAVPGDYIWLWLGSDNSKGMPTDWKQGLRAFGKLKNKKGGPGYNDDWELEIEVPIILQKSILHKDLLAKSPTAYYWCSNMPVLGISTYSNQTAQLVKSEDKNQNIKALMYSVEAVQPGFRAQIESTYPQLKDLFNYTPVSPHGDPRSSMVAPSGADVSDESIPDQIPAVWVLALASKGLLLSSGPSGTGKSRSARDIARALDYTLPPEYAATAISCRPANCLAFIPVGADWTDATPLVGFRNIFGSERIEIDENGNERKTNEAWEPPSALRLLLRAIKFPDQPHFLVLDEMNLSHVERYFGPFLSLIESNRGLDPSSKQLLLDANEVRLISETLRNTNRFPLECEVATNLATAGNGLAISDNIFVVGTVNVDETTYMFSPKVLDRSHVIELEAPDPRKYLKNELDIFENSISIDTAKFIFQRSIQRRRNGFWERETPSEILRQGALGTVWEPDLSNIETAIIKCLAGLQKLLTPISFAFAYRTMNELYSYMATFLECDDKNLFKFDSDIPSWQAALDLAIYQKVLPKIHGTRRQLGDSLRGVSEFLEGNSATYNLGFKQVTISGEEKIGFPLHKSLKKIGSMMLRLEATGHTTFVE
jgi:hypothetical protein